MRFALIKLILMLPVYSFSQSEYSNPEKIRFKDYDLTVEESIDSVQLPFASIKIIDSRFDTSKIGFNITQDFYHGQKDPFKKIRFTGGVANSIEKYYNDYYQKSFQKNGFILLIVMKKFWISDISSYERQGKFFRPQNLKQLYYKWEYYIGKDSNYLPVKRIDNIYDFSKNLPGNSKYKDEFKEKYMPEIKALLKSMIESIDFEKAKIAFETAGKKTLNEILVYNNKRFQLPILKDKNIKMGVFLNFDEFKNNTPSEELIRQELKHKFKGPYILKDQKSGKELDEYWGFYQPDIVTIGKLINKKLYRVGNTFDFFIKRYWAEETLYTNPYNSYFQTTTYRLWIPCQLDMETGEIY